ncbi:MAG: hypothetical protein WD768_01085, partial [Phycisphaeraceae bacterium]
MTSSFRLIPLTVIVALLAACGSTTGPAPASRPVEKSTAAKITALGASITTVESSASASPPG